MLAYIASIFDRKDVENKCIRQNNKIKQNKHSTGESKIFQISVLAQTMHTDYESEKMTIEFFTCV